MTDNNKIYINEARTILNYTLDFVGNNGFFPREDDYVEFGITMRSINKYFGTINSAIDASNEYYNDMNYDLEYVIRNRIIFMKKWNNYCRKYNKTHPEINRKCIINKQSKRRGWAKPKPINKPFEGAHLHHTHINNDHQMCIYIPSTLHQSVWHSHGKKDTMDEINKLAFEWLATCDVI